MLSRKEFKRQYGAELLPSSASNYSVGDIWDKVGLTDRLSPENENIAYICNNEALAKELEKIKKVEANFPDIDITSDINADAGVNIPTFKVSVKEALKVNKVTKMIIKGVSAKNSLNGYRSKMNEAVESIKKTNLNKYKKYIRTKEIVTCLFYAESVVIEITKEVSNKTEFKLEIEQTFDINAKVNFGSDKSVTITLSNPICPFAAQFESGRDI